MIVSLTSDELADDDDDDDEGDDDNDDDDSGDSLPDTLREITFWV